MLEDNVRTLDMSASRLEAYIVAGPEGQERQAEAPAALNALLASLHDHHPLSDLADVREAYRFAAQAHDRQRRASGEPLPHKGGGRLTR